MHPDDKMALELEGEGNVGKTECWYILSADEGSKLVYGLNGKYSHEELALAIKSASLEKYLNYVEVHAGAFLYIPSGIVHAIGGGIRLMEVQQSCDLTYRLYDYGRGREVHIEKGLKVIKEDKKLKVEPFSGNFECQYFSLQKVNVKGGWSMFCSNIDKPEGVQLIYVVSSNKAVIKNSEMLPVTICDEDVWAVEPGEKITIEGQAQIIRIRCN